MNRIAGFLLVATPTAKRTDQAITIDFTLYRDFVVQLLFVIMAFASIILVSFLFTLRRTEELAISIASSFISLWSIRGIIAQGLETFPSFLDFWTMALFATILMGTVLKLILNRSRNVRSAQDI